MENNFVTNYEQGKFLEEAFGEDTADFVYVDYGYTTRILPKNDMDAKSYPILCYAWTLTALRKLLPTSVDVGGVMCVFSSHNTFDNNWVYMYISDINNAPLYTKKESEIDACYEMIAVLNKKGLL